MMTLSSRRFRGAGSRWPARAILLLSRTSRTVTRKGSKRSPWGYTILSVCIAATLVCGLSETLAAERQKTMDAGAQVDAEKPDGRASARGPDHRCIGCGGWHAGTYGIRPRLLHEGNPAIAILLLALLESCYHRTSRCYPVALNRR